MKKCIDKCELWPVYVLGEPAYASEPTIDIPDELVARADAALKELKAVSELLRALCGGTDE